MKIYILIFIHIFICIYIFEKLIFINKASLYHHHHHYIYKSKHII